MIITSVAGIVLVLPALEACSSASSPAKPAAAASPKPSISTQAYSDQDDDAALCKFFNANIGKDDQAIQDTISQDGSTVTPALANLMESAIQNAGTVQLAEQGQLAVAADCALVHVGKRPVSNPLGPLAASSSSSTPTPVAAPTMTKQTDRIVFKVWGSGDPTVQYGSDSSNNDVGSIGSGVALPWSGSMTYNPSALYYAVSAQLQGGGVISDSVTEVIRTYCSDGKHKTESFALASGHASGGYAIAQAEYADGDTGNASQAESDAGC
jgi:hypothetical protein